VYVSDLEGHRIERFTRLGAYVASWGSPGTGEGQFQYPTQLGVAPNGIVYVPDSANDRVQAFTADGTFVSSFGSNGTGPGQFITVFDVDVGPTGLIYVDDLDDRIEVFDHQTPARPSTWGRLKSLYR
jgi:DNA-binding beta-propeller fold protein YncE